MTRVLVAENIGGSGIALLREHFDVDLDSTGDPSSSASGSATTRAC